MAIERDELDEIVRRITETGGLTDDMLGDVRRLRDELDEREAMLNKYKEDRDSGETRGEVREQGEEITNWKEKFDDLERRYKERFMERPTTPDTVKLDQTEDVRRDGEPQTFDELFERREG